MSIISKFITSVALFVATTFFSSAAQADIEDSAVLIKPASFAKRIAPKYPRSRQRKGHGGAVELSLMVDENGKPFEIIVLRSSHADFEKPAVTAVGKYLYVPATQNDLPVMARDRVVVYYEIEGQGNTMSQSFYKWLGRDGGLFVGDDAELKTALKSLKKGLGRTKTRCDFAWLSVFQSQFAQKFQPLDEQIESVYSVLMFDYELDPERRCFTDEHRIEFVRNLLNLLIGAEKLGEASHLVEYLDNSDLNNLFAEFTPAIQSLEDSSPKLDVISTKDIKLNANQALIELPKRQFKIDMIPDRLDRLTLRCANGFRVLEISKSLIYEIPPELKSCQLRIEVAQQ